LFPFSENLLFRKLMLNQFSHWLPMISIYLIVNQGRKRRPFMQS